MAISIKEQITEWRAKAEENAHKRQEQNALNEAKELQRLRAERLRDEAEAQRLEWREKEIAGIQKAKSEIAEANKLKAQRSKEKWAKAVAFVGRAVGRKSANAPRYVESKPRLNIFNPPNVFSGQRTTEIKRASVEIRQPKTTATGVSLFNPPNIWTGKRVRK